MGGQQTSLQVLRLAHYPLDSMSGWLNASQTYIRLLATPSTSTKHEGTRVEWRRMLQQLRGQRRRSRTEMFSISPSRRCHQVSRSCDISAVNGGTISIDRQGSAASTIRAASAHPKFRGALVFWGCDPTGLPPSKCAP